MDFVLRRSNDGRVISQSYSNGSRDAFCLAEQTNSGVLITEFDSGSMVLNQLCVKGTDATEELLRYVGRRNFEIEDVGDYKGIEISAICRKCGSVGLLRELDAIKPQNIKDIPVVPIFLCKSCGSRHYSLTDKYLELLAKGNSRLFEKKELDELNSDPGSAIKVLNEYIIRIFASKKISRIEIK